MNGTFESRRGFFITFEGGEGTGKTSQINILKTKLKALNVPVIATREPGGTPGAEAVRHVLLSGKAESLGAEAEAILFAAARSDHIEQVIRPALSEGAIVLCDRFIDSTRVYQGVTGKVDIELLKKLESVVCDGAFPDLTLILDIPPEEGMIRAGARRKSSETADRFERENLEVQRKRRDAFRKLAENEPDRCVLIDASGSENEVSDRIWSIVEPRLQQSEII